MDFTAFPAFSGLSESEIDQITRAGDPLQLLPGEELIEQGTEATRLFLVTEGRLSVHITAGDGEHELAALEAPCVIGEIELLHAGTHAASVTALDVCAGIAVPYDIIHRQLDSGDLASLKLARNLSRLVAARLYRLDHEIVAMLWTPEEPTDGPKAGRLAELSNEALLKKLIEW